MLDVHDPIDDPIEKLAVVRDEQERSRIREQPALQPENRIEIQVVGRLIEQQKVGPAHQRLSNVQADAPAAGEGTHRTLFVRGGEAEAMHESSGPASGIVTTSRGVTRMQLAQFQPLIARFGRRDGLLQAPQLGVPVQHELDRLLPGGYQLL